MCSEIDNNDNFLLTSTLKLGVLKGWIASKNDDAKANLIKLINHSLYNRYLKHIETIDSGLLKLAVACFTIETLESFRQGRDSTKGIGKKIFNDFFKEEEANFPHFSDISIDFYENIRCGILHQADTKNGWRVLQKGAIMDITEKTINANEFIASLKKSIDIYIADLASKNISDNLWKNAIKKFEHIITNCKSSS